MLRSSKPNFRSAPITPICEHIFEPVETEDGKIIECREVDVTSPGACKGMPNPEDYTLENIFASGVKVEKVDSKCVKISNLSDSDAVMHHLVTALEAEQLSNQTE